MSFPQLLEAIAEHSRTSSHSLEAEMLAAFRAVDREGRGTIAPSELRRMLSQMGEKLTANEGSDFHTLYCSTPLYSCFRRSQSTHCCESAV